MDFTENNIHYIKKLCGEFVEEHYRNEEIYFDEFWKIYEPALLKWVGKPPKKWRLKLSRRRFPKVIGMTDGSQTVELVTPMVIETLISTLIQIASLKDYASISNIKGIEEIIKRCGKKLPESIRTHISNFFVPLLHADLNKSIELPKKTMKKRIEMYSHLGKEEFTKKEYLSKKQELGKTKKDYFMFINEETGEFYVYGKSQSLSPYSKALLILLLKKAGEPVGYKYLYESITGLKVDKMDSELFEFNVYKWYSNLNKKIDKRVKKCLKTERGIGYKIILENNEEYCLIDYI